MRNYLVLLLTLLTAACSGGGSGGSSSAPPPVPTSTVSGAAVDGLIIQGTVRIYDFTGGSQGSLLGFATTDIRGHYSIALQVESRPVLVEVTGGYYIEEASATQVPLGAGLKMTALFNHATGQPVTIAVTAYTHAAAALAQYLVAQGSGVAAAIDAANSRFGVWVGHSITATVPLDITDPGNAVAQPTPAHNYGFLAGAISNWTEAHNPTGVIPHTTPYRSIEFIQKMHDDLRADGLLDGRGTGGAALSFGTTPLSVNVYRAELAMNILRIADDGVNRTGLTGAQLLQYARAYAASVDPVFNNITPISIDQPVVTVTSPSNSQFVAGVVTVNGIVTDTAGPGTVNLIVDGVLGSAATNHFNPSVSWDTRTVTDGPHNVGFTVINFVGFSSTTVNIPIVDNTPPVALPVSVSPASGGLSCLITGYSIDGLSGIANVSVDGRTVSTLSGPWAGLIPPTTFTGFCISTYDRTVCRTVNVTETDSASNSISRLINVCVTGRERDFVCELSAGCSTQ